MPRGLRARLPIWGVAATGAVSASIAADLIFQLLAALPGIRRPEGLGINVQQREQGEELTSSLQDGSPRLQIDGTQMFLHYVISPPELTPPPGLRHPLAIVPPDSPPGIRSTG